MADINVMNSKALKVKIIQNLSPILERYSYLFSALNSGNSSCYLVGGIIRDASMNIQSTDVDIAVRLRPNEVISRLTSMGFRTYSTGIKHGTITALLDDGLSAEITTYRLPNPKNEPLFSDSIEVDLSGRDFTINAIAFDPYSKDIVDPSDGLGDITRKILRCVGDPNERLREDPLRIMRMVRFGTASGLKIDDKTFASAKSISNTVNLVSIERIRDELIHILCSDYPRSGFYSLRDLGLLNYILPELIPSIGCDQNKWHTEDVFDHTMSVIERTSKQDKILRLTALFHDTGKPASLSVDDNGDRHFYGHEVISATLSECAMKRMRFANDEIDKVKLLVRNHMRSIDCGTPGVRRLLRDLGDEFFRFRSFQDADKTPTLSELDHKIRMNRFDALVEAERIRLKGKPVDILSVNGHDIISLGVPAGPIVGNILNKLAERVLDNPDINEKEALLKLATFLIAGDESEVNL